MDEAQLNLDHEARVMKRAYILIKPVLGRKVLFFPRLKMSYLKDSSYQLLGELSISLIGLTELTNSVRKICETSSSITEWCSNHMRIHYHSI